LPDGLQICRQGYIKKRAIVIKKFIRVVNESVQLHNYNGAMAVMSGLCKSAVQRLKKTWDLVPSKDRDLFTELEALLSVDRNYGRYRDRVAQLERANFAVPMVPYLGVLLRDLTFMQDGNPKFLKSGLVNFGKIRMVVDRIVALRPLQARGYRFADGPTSAAARHLLQEMNIIQDENRLYACSLYCEPREGGPDKGSSSSNSAAGGAASPRKPPPAKDPRTTAV